MNAAIARRGDRRRTFPFRLILRIALPLLVIAAAAAGAALLFANQPGADRAPAQTKPQARLVTVAPAQAAPPTRMLKANGTVEAAQSTKLRARVSGQITWLRDALAPGTRFHKGDVLARLDAADYKLALTQAKTQLASAQAALQTENGQQAVAKRELSLVGQDVSAKERKLALRAPQLATAKAKVESAQSAVAQARLNLKRTRVRAPFTGIVTARSASVGDVVSTADTLATLAATDAYWVDASIPVGQLRWLHAARGADAGSSARIYYPAAWGDNAYLPASVLRVQAALETNGRMARVLLKVPHPLADGAPKSHRLLLGAYVRAKIRARSPANSVVIASANLRGNNRVWVMAANHTLDIRTVDVVYQDSGRAVIAGGLAPGDQVVTSELNAPVQGMPIRIENQPARSVANKNAGTSRRPRDKPVHSNTRDNALSQPLRLAPAFKTLVRSRAGAPAAS